MKLLRRTWHVVSILTLLLTFGCALSSDANQREANREQEPADDAPSQPPAPAIISPSTGNPGEQGTEQDEGATHPLREFLTERFVDPVTWFTGGLLALGILQYRAMRKQADYMREGLDETRASIAEATRSAKAMEGIAGSLAESTVAVKDSLLITQGMADTQRFVFELSNRAWLSVTFEAMFGQDNARRLPFEPRFNLVNNGNTPAYNVRILAAADVLPFPVPDDFAFPLPAPVHGSRISVIGPGLSKRVGAPLLNLYALTDETQIRAGLIRRIVSWGLIQYVDAFEKERFVRFSFTHFHREDGDWFSQDTGRHSESN